MWHLANKQVGFDDKGSTVYALKSAQELRMHVCDPYKDFRVQSVRKDIRRLVASGKVEVVRIAKAHECGVYMITQINS